MPASRRLAVRDDTETLSSLRKFGQHIVKDLPDRSRLLNLSNNLTHRVGDHFFGPRVSNAPHRLVRKRSLHRVSQRLGRSWLLPRFSPSAAQNAAVLPAPDLGQDRVARPRRQKPLQQFRRYFALLSSEPHRAAPCAFGSQRQGGGDLPAATDTSGG